MREDAISRLSERWLKDLEEETASWLQDIVKDTFDLAVLMAFAKSLGVDPSKLAGMATGTSAFDPYKILGLERSASDEEVKKRFNDLIRKIHPDVAGVPGTDFLTHLVVAAYDLIRKERGF